MNMPDYMDFEQRARTLQGEEVCRVCALVARLLAAVVRRIARALPGRRYA